MDLDGIGLNSLSWADDLVIISTSKNGLQKCLNNLSEYCNKWDLTINIHKTKVMVLSAGNAYVNDIQFNNDFLECVSTYKYLGLVWSRNGNLTRMEQDRVEKARKASFAIQKAISTSQNVSVDHALSLLDKQLEPILQYGCPIWGFPSNNCSIRLKYDSIDTKQLKKQLYTILKSIEVTDVEILYC